MTARCLVERTVYLKVAHHGSHNGTRKAALELMRHRDLCAFIPVDEGDAKKVKWGEMPFHAIETALGTKTAGRVIRADAKWIKTNAQAPDALKTPCGCIKSLDRDPDGLWVEVEIA